MSFIQNLSIKDIQTGTHIIPYRSDVLIQIVDPAYGFPTPKHNFSEIHQFEFLDIENELGDIGEFAMTDVQAKSIVEILESAYRHRANVFVHCHAGLCRSGAVAEVGLMLGFEDTGRYRLPNVLVKKKLMKALGWTYDAKDDFVPETTESGIIIASNTQMEYGS